MYIVELHSFHKSSWSNHGQNDFRVFHLNDKRWPRICVVVSLVTTLFRVVEDHGS